MQKKSKEHYGRIVLHQANDVLKARVQTAFLFKPRTSRESLRRGKQAACKVSKNGSSKDC